MTVHGKVNRSAVLRDSAASYLLTSLVAFGITVIAVRLFLQLTGFPQIGNSVLHFAHALWGALLIFIAVLLPLLYANRWAAQASALLSGIGIGLFIDEIGKFITQKNDYFFPPALPLIYGFFLLIVFFYLYFRRSRQIDPRKAMYNALDKFQDILDGDLDLGEAARIEKQLEIGRSSQEHEIQSLARVLSNYLQDEKGGLVPSKPGYWRRLAYKVDELGQKLGRRFHRTLISVLLILFSISSVLVIAAVAFIAFGDIDFTEEAVRASFNSSELSIVKSTFWLMLILILEVVIGGMVIYATFTWLRGDEQRGQKFAALAMVISLVLLQPLLFYMNQMAALGGTLYQFAILLTVIAYGRWYLEDVKEH